MTGDEAIGVRVVRRALSRAAATGSPRTPGRRAPSWWQGPPSCRDGQGFNAATREYGDLMAQGVIDPVKVTRSAVQNAASIAGMLLTTEATVVEKPEKEAPADGHGHSHGHGHAH